MFCQNLAYPAVNSVQIGRQMAFEWFANAKLHIFRVNY